MSKMKRNYTAEQKIVNPLKNAMAILEEFIALKCKNNKEKARLYEVIKILDQVLITEKKK